MIISNSSLHVTIIFLIVSTLFSSSKAMELRKKPAALLSIKKRSALQEVAQKIKTGSSYCGNKCLECSAFYTKKCCENYCLPCLQATGSNLIYYCDNLPSCKCKIPCKNEQECAIACYKGIALGALSCLTLRALIEVMNHYD